MGQAFDGDGQLIGEAFGQTKREVFNELITKYPTAAEIRIRSLSGENQPSTQMPRYRCHKEVWALKIATVIDPTEPGNDADGSRIICPAETGYSRFAVDAAYVRKHNPVAGGYYVVYADGYQSFSPAIAFENGYTRL